MDSLYKDEEAKKYEKDILGMRVYTSRLLGASQDLALHGGGNTSVKIDDILYVKGSGWDLGSIEKEGFSPVNLNALIKMAEYESLSDTQMVKAQREAMSDKNAPNPSIEAILHAIIPFRFVDHTHADAIVTISNTPKGKEIIEDLFKDMLIIDYVMPGFILAKEVYKKSKRVDWKKLGGIILLNHGIFTFDDDAKKSYEKMIDAVSKAEKYLEKNVKSNYPECTPKKLSMKMIDLIKSEVKKLRGCKIYIMSNTSKEACYFSTLENLSSIVLGGPLTPEHVIRTKPFPVIITDDPILDIKAFVKDYKEYFETFSKDEVMLDLAPRYAIVRGYGILVFGKDQKEAKILFDITDHTIKAILKGLALGGWKSLLKKEIFDMEYWELEQAKIKK